jgi:hypothetical protein
MTSTLGQVFHIHLIYYSNLSYLQMALASQLGKLKLKTAKELTKVAELTHDS